MQVQSLTSHGFEVEAVSAPISVEFTNANRRYLQVSECGIWYVW